MCVFVICDRNLVYFHRLSVRVRRSDRHQVLSLSVYESGTRFRSRRFLVRLWNCLRRSASGWFIICYAFIFYNCSL